MDKLFIRRISSSLAKRKLHFSSRRKLSSTSTLKNDLATGRKGDDEAYFKYMPLEGVERIERYRSGGYHPVAIGDYLHDRYRIVHKLGFGGYSTIWLAKDEKADRYVGVKILVADGKSRESTMLHQLSSGNIDNRHPGKDIIRPILDEFVIKGPNGEHQCLVTAPASMSLSDAIESSYERVFQLPVARVIVAQLVQAVAFLHSQGIGHADIHLGNILLRLPLSIDRFSPDQFYARYSPPKFEPVVRLDNQPLPLGVPSHGIMPVWLGKDSELISLSETRILLGDFGESFQPSATSRYHSNTPVLSSPPELNFEPKKPLSFPADIWSLGCTIYSLIGSRPLFEGLAPNADWMTMEQVTVLGKLPSDWWGKWDRRLQWFNEDGTRNHQELGRPWAERFEKFVQEPRRESGVGEIEDEEKASLFTMLKSMLAFRPEERLTVEEVLASKWMEEWSLPALERMRHCDNEKVVI